MRTLAVAHLIKVEYGINASILGKSKLFDVQEKHLRQALKGVKYQSRSQQKQQKGHASETFTPSKFWKEDQDSDPLKSESSSS